MFGLVFAAMGVMWHCNCCFRLSCCFVAVAVDLFVFYGLVFWHAAGLV